MKIFMSIKYHPDPGNRAHVEALLALLESNGFEATCVVRDVEGWGAQPFSPTELMRRTLAEIDACDLLLVDLAEKGTGLGIEAGYAHARGIPIVTILPRESDLSPTLQGISCGILRYNRVTDLAPWLAELRAVWPEELPSQEFL